MVSLSAQVMASPPQEVLESLTQHSALTSLSARTLAVAQAAFAAGRPELLAGSAVAELDVPGLPALDAASAETPYGNLLQILDKGPNGRQEWLLVSALCAFAYAELWSDSSRQSESLSQLIWLATHTGCDPWPHLDALLDQDGRSALWSMLGATLAGAGSHRAEQCIGLLALVRAPSAEAAQVCQNALTAAVDPLTVALLASRARAGQPLRGQLKWQRSTSATILLALTGLLLVSAFFRIVLRYGLGLRREGQLVCSPRGVELSYKTNLLGKKIREKAIFIPLDNIGSLCRATRFDRPGLYAGLGALALGSYFGTAWLSDGLRAPGGSPSLLSMGLAAIAVGIAVDFALSTWFGRGEGLVRISVTPRRGKAFALARVPAERADSLFQEITALRGFSRF